MTVFAKQNERDPKQVDLQVTSGPVSVTVTEYAQHLRSVWGQLGHLIAEAEGTTTGKRAYDRYREHAGGVSLVSGEQLPEFEDLSEDIQSAWHHSAG